MTKVSQFLNNIAKYTAQSRLESPHNRSAWFAGFAFFVLLISIFGNSKGQGLGVFEIFMKSTGGAYPLTVPLRDSVLYPVQYLQPEMNKMYQRFWEPDGFTIFEDMEVTIGPDKFDKKGITLTYKMVPKLAHHDKGFGAHSRLARIMISHLKKEVGVPDTVLFWNAIVDTTFKQKQKYVFGVLPKKVEPIYEDPTPSDSAAYNAIKDRPVTMSSTTAIEFAIRLFEQQAEGFQRVYQPILNFDNLQYGEDADIVIAKHPIDVDIILILFRLNTRAVKVDPKLDQTRILAEGIVKKMKKKTEDFSPHWLKIAAAVDTSEGRRAPILLVGAQ